MQARDMDEIRFPNNIAAIRRMRGLAQAYVAEQIGVSRPKYIDIEKGIKELTVSQVKKLGEVLDASFEDLLGVDTGNFDYKKFLQKSEPTPDINKKSSLKLFEDKVVRSVWDEAEEKWWFSVIDIVQILTGTDNPRRYWSDLKRKLKDEGSQLYEKIVQLKMISSDGKKYKTDAADTEQIFRIIQSIPSKKAEPFKRWLAKVGSERIDQMVDPEQSIHQALEDYRRLGYSDGWINQRLKSIEIRKDLTDVWNRHGVKTGQEYATLTDIIYQTWAGKNH